MRRSTVEVLIDLIQQEWPKTPDKKSRPYVGAFINRARTGRKLTARVEGNHGIYTVSLENIGQRLESACSCYIGRHGGCHHCHALALTFLREPDSFQVVQTRRRKDVRTVTHLPSYLKGVKLDALLKQLKDKGITQKALAESMGMNPRHLTAIKSSESRNRFFNELGATKLACLWVLEHCADNQ